MKRLVDKKEIELVKKRLSVRPSINCSNCTYTVTDTNSIGEPELVCAVSRRMEFVTRPSDVCDLWGRKDA